MNKVNHSDWFGYVTDLMHRKLLKAEGYGDRLEEALDECMPWVTFNSRAAVYSCRWRFREDPEMTEFFKGLIHVKMDLTGDGPLKYGCEIQLIDPPGLEMTRLMQTFSLWKVKTSSSKNTLMTARRQESRWLFLQDLGHDPLSANRSRKYTT